MDLNSVGMTNYQNIMFKLEDIIRLAKEEFEKINSINWKIFCEL